MIGPDLREVSTRGSESSPVRVLTPFTLQDLAADTSYLGKRRVENRSQLASAPVVPFVETLSNGSVRFDCLIMWPSGGYTLTDFCHRLAPYQDERFGSQSLEGGQKDVDEITTEEFELLYGDHARWFGEVRFQRMIEVGNALLKAQKTPDPVLPLGDDYSTKDPFIRDIQRPVENDFIPKRRRAYFFYQYKRSPLARIYLDPETIKTLSVGNGQSVEEQFHTLNDEWLTYRESGDQDFFAKPLFFRTIDGGILLAHARTFQHENAAERYTYEQQRAYFSHFELLFEPKMNNNVLPVVSFTIDHDGKVHLCFDPQSDAMLAEMREHIYPNRKLLQNYIGKEAEAKYAELSDAQFNQPFGHSVLTALDPGLRKIISGFTHRYMPVTNADGSTRMGKQAMVMLQALMIPMIPHDNIESIYTHAELFTRLVHNVKGQLA